MRVLLACVRPEVQRNTKCEYASGIFDQVKVERETCLTKGTRRCGATIDWRSDQRELELRCSLKKSTTDEARGQMKKYLSGALQLDIQRTSMWLAVPVVNAEWQARNNAPLREHFSAKNFNAGPWLS